MGIKKLLLVLGLLLAGVVFSFVVFFVNSGRLDKSELGNDDGSFRVALVLSGYKDDSGLFVSAYDGLMSVKEELGAFVSLRENVSATDLEFSIRGFALDGYELVIVSGDDYEDVVGQVAGDFPDVSFVVLNSSVANGSNLGSLSVDYRAIGFIKGVLACYITRNDIVAGVGLVDEPATLAELYGFERGVSYVDPNVQVHADFAENLEAGRTIADMVADFISYGSDIVVSVAGSADEDVFEQAAKGGSYGISSDVRFFDAFPETVIAGSKVDVAASVADLARVVHDGGFNGDSRSVAYELVYNPGLKARISAYVESKVKVVIDKIISGELDMDVLVPMED